MSSSRTWIRHIPIRENAADRITFIILDLNGVPIDLTGWGARVMFRAAYSDTDTIVSFTVGAGLVLPVPDQPANNQVSLTWTASQATAVRYALGLGGRGVWDLWLDPNGTPDADSWLAVKGDVNVEGVATR